MSADFPIFLTFTEMAEDLALDHLVQILPSDAVHA
jgi:hypothetical protein